VTYGELYNRKKGEKDRKRDKVIKINIVIKRRTEREER